MKSQKVPTTTTEKKTVVLIKKPGLAEETSKEVTPCPLAIKGLYRLPKIHKKIFYQDVVYYGTYGNQHLTGILNISMDFSALIKYSETFIQKLQNPT
jgi:hypothetical protein